VIGETIWHDRILSRLGRKVALLPICRSTPAGNVDLRAAPIDGGDSRGRSSGVIRIADFGK
jgi:hypothetical protein